MTIVYRVQDKDGHGAYYDARGQIATDLLSPEHAALAARRGPLGDFERDHAQLRAFFWDWIRAFKFAFPSVEAAYRWFPYPAMAYLEARGYFLQAVEADVVRVSDSGEQVIYRCVEPCELDVRGVA